VEDKKKRGYLNIWNQGIPRFPSRIQELMDQIPFQSLLDGHVDSVMKGTAKKNRCGNYQLSFGICSSNSMKKWLQEVIEQNFGAAFLLSGQELRLLQYTASHHSGSTHDWELSHRQTSIPKYYVHPFQ
jgi:hypothetical protein